MCWENCQQKYCYFLNVFNINFNLLLNHVALSEKRVPVTPRNDLCFLGVF